MFARFQIARGAGSLQYDLPSFQLGRIKVHTRQIVLILVLIIGITARTYDFGNNPPGLNVDEASTGYDSYAIANYGVDRNGQSYPVHLIAWGSGQNALYAYIIAPFIRVFGLSPVTNRIGNLIFGIITLLLLYLIIKKTMGVGLALISAFILGISPWGIMVSRWGLPENILPAIVTIAIYFYVLSLKKPRYLPLAFAVFALSLYAYGTAYFVVPLLMLSLSFWSYRNAADKTRCLRNISLSWFVFLLLSLPIIFFVYINIFSNSSMSIKILGISIPKLTTPGARYAQVLVLDRGISSLPEIWTKLASYFRYYYETVFMQQGAIWNVINNQVHRFGNLYILSNFFFILGFIAGIKELIQYKLQTKNSAVIIFMSWFILSTILGIISETNTNRINIIFIPMIFFVSLGISKLSLWLGLVISSFVEKYEDKRYLFSTIKFTTLLVIGIIYCNLFLGFLKYYFNPKFYPDHIGHYFHESFIEAVNYVSGINTTDKKVIISDVSNAYIYVLFSTRYNPYKYLETVQYKDPYSSFRVVRSFGNYEFLQDVNYIIPHSNTFYIVENKKKNYFNNTNFLHFKEFKRFSVYEY